MAPKPLLLMQICVYKSFAKSLSLTTFCFLSSVLVIIIICCEDIMVFDLKRWWNIFESYCIEFYDSCTF